MRQHPLKALHIHQDSSGNWYVVATSEQDGRLVTQVVYRPDEHHWPVFYPMTGELIWELKPTT